MFRKTIISEFFTTVSFRQALQSLYLMTFWLWKLKYWKDSGLLALEFLNKLRFKNKNQEIVSFYNWRSIIFSILKWLKIKNNDEIIVNHIKALKKQDHKKLYELMTKLIQDKYGE